MTNNQLFQSNDTLIKEVLENISTHNSQRKFEPEVSWKDVETWRMNAVGPLIEEITELYSRKIGTPTSIIDIGPQSIKGCKFFYGRIIIYEDAQLIVIMDRVEHKIIPFGSFLGFAPIDMSKSKVIGGEIESKISVSPVVGVGLIGSLAEGLTGGGVLGGAAFGREYSHKPIRVQTTKDFALSIKTNNLKETELLVYFNEDLNSLEKFCDILNIILSKEEYRKNTSPIVKMDFNFAEIFSSLYSTEIERLYTEFEEKNKQSRKEHEEKLAQNNGCIITILIAIVTTLSLYFAT